MKTVRRMALVLALSLVIVSCGGDDGGVAPTTEATVATTIDTDDRTPVILDYSPTVSDVGALVFLATHPDLHLIAVTLPGTGESHCGPGVAHTRGALEELGLADVPVACGPDVGFGPLNPFPDGWRERSDTIDLPEATPNESRTAPELIANLLEQSAVPVEIVAVGPLTNLAIVLSEHPELSGRIAGITIMGGAVNAAGNVPPVAGWEHANPYAEVNFWVDPDAAARVIGSDVPVTLIPLDATNDVPVDEVFHAGLVSSPATTASALLARVWAQAPEWVTDGYFLWDELAAAVLADESLVTYTEMVLVVDAGALETAGWIREDPSGSSVRVATSADRAAFESVFLGTLFGREVDLGRPAATAAQAIYFEEVEDASAEYEGSLGQIFVDVSAGLGLGEEALGLGGEVSDAEWVQVIQIASPQILDGPMVRLVETLEAIVAPHETSELHVTWLAALNDVLANRDDVLLAIAEAGIDGAAGADAYLVPVVEACLAVQAAGNDLGLSVDLGC